MISLSIDGKRPGSDLETKKIIYEISPICFWCGIKTYLWEDRIEKQSRPQKATIDHLYSKTDKRRKWFQNKKISSPILLCCYKCNHNRNHRTVELFSKKKQPKEPNNIYIFTSVEKQIDIENMWSNYVR